MTNGDWRLHTRLHHDPNRNPGSAIREPQKKLEEKTAYQKLPTKCRQIVDFCAKGLLEGRANMWCSMTYTNTFLSPIFYRSFIFSGLIGIGIQQHPQVMKVGGRCKLPTRQQWPAFLYIFVEAWISFNIKKPSPLEKSKQKPSLKWQRDVQSWLLCLSICHVNYC